MENNTTPFESLFEKVEDYGKTTLTLLKLNAVDKSADVFSFLIIKMVLFLVVVLFLFTLSIGISLWLGDLLGKSYYGFFIITGLYFLIGLFIQVFKTSLIGGPVRKAVILEMLKKDDDEE